jgi:hypothetical protein
MKFRVGRFTCELSLDDRGEVEATWLPWQPRYLSRNERAQYRAGRAVFLGRVNPGSMVDAMDRPSSIGSRHACATGERFDRGGADASGSDAKTAAIPLALPSLQAIALAQFVKRVDFETVTRFAPVSVVCDDGKSEADLIWLALIELRRALAEVSTMTKSSAETEGRAPPGYPLLGALKGLVQVMPGTDLTRPACPDWGED